jgi:hypothetical protein
VGEVIGVLRELHDEELHNLYSLPSVIKINKSRKIKWAGHVKRIGRMREGYLRESQKEKDHKEDLDIGRRIILK